MIRPRAVAIDDASLDVEAQLADFIGEHYDRLVRLATLICHSNDSVEDAVQAAMERAWRGRDTLRDPSRLKPWLDQIVVREAIRVNRRPWWSLGTRVNDDELNAIAGRNGGADAALIALGTAFRGLPAEQRAAVALHLYAGYSVEETADLMGAGIETTRSRLRLARQRLRRELTEDGR